MIPDAVDILGKRYKVVVNDKQEGDYGVCDYDACAIELAGYQCAQQMRDTLLHEVIHGIDHEMHGTGGALKESHLRAIATGLYAVLRHNPVLVTYLTAE